MAKEEIKKDETANSDAEVEETEEQEEADDSEQSESQDNQNEIDWKAEAEKERLAREAAEKALAERGFKDRERKRKQDDGEDEDINDDDKPLTAKDLNVVLSRATEQAKKELQGERIAEIANELANGNSDKANYIIQIHTNRSFPSHLSLREQLEESVAIADRKTLVSTNAELRRALKSKTTASKDVASGHHDSLEGIAPKLSGQDKAAYERAGFKYDAKERIYKKKLPSGKFLYKDPRTKATFVK